MARQPSTKHLRRDYEASKHELTPEQRASIEQHFRNIEAADHVLGWLNRQMALVILVALAIIALTVWLAFG